MSISVQSIHEHLTELNSTLVSCEKDPYLRESIRKTNEVFLRCLFLRRSQTGYALSARAENALVGLEYKIRKIYLGRYKALLSIQGVPLDRRYVDRNFRDLEKLAEQLYLNQEETIAATLSCLQEGVRCSLFENLCIATNAPSVSRALGEDIFFNTEKSYSTSIDLYEALLLCLVKKDRVRILAKVGDLERMRLLYSMPGSDANSIEDGDMRTASLLFGMGLPKDAEIGLEDDLAALDIAAKAGHTSLVEFLLTKDKKISNAAIWERVILAAKEGDQKVLRCLFLSRRVITNNTVEKALACAAQNAHVHIIDMLISYSSFKGGKTSYQKIMLHPVEEKHLSVLQYFFSSHLELSVACLRNALIYFAKIGHIEALDLLFSMQNDGKLIPAARTALEKAVRNNRLDVANFFKAKNIHLEDQKYLSILQELMMKNRVPALQWILQENDDLLKNPVTMWLVAVHGVMYSSAEALAVIKEKGPLERLQLASLLLYVQAGPSKERIIEMIHSFELV